MGIIVSFFGADHKCGCSQICQCIGEKLAALNPELKVLIIHAEEKMGDDYSPHLGESMERIQPYLKGEIYNSQEIAEKSHYLKNLFIIGGANTLGSNDMFSPDTAQNFILEMKSNFDFVVCDCGANINHGLSLGSLFAAEKLYIVFTQSESCIRRFEWMRCLFDKLEINTDNIIINKYTKASAYDIEYFTNRLGIKKESVSLICKADKGDMAELMEKSLLGFKSRAFSKDIEKLTKEIIASLNSADILI